MPHQVAVIGSSNVDFVMKMDRLPAKGETVTDALFTQTFGGKGANQAVACARAGAEVLFVNGVGKDPYTKQMLKNFKEDGMDCSLIQQFDNCPSGHALCMIGERGQNYLSVAPGANYRLTPDILEQHLELLRNVPLWMLQCEIPPESNRFLLEKAKSEQNRIIWNFAPAISMQSIPYAACDIMIVNEIEAAQLTQIPVQDMESAARAANWLLDKGVQDVVVTMGQQGAFYCGTEGIYIQPTFDIKVVDTVGAGDTFCGALACALSEGQSWKDALVFANAAASLSVSRLGAQSSIPGREEIMAFLSSNT